MPDRYSGRKNDRNLRNMDDEDTMLLYGVSDPPPAKKTELPPLRRTSRVRRDSHQQSAGPAPQQQYRQQENYPDYQYDDGQYQQPQYYPQQPQNDYYDEYDYPQPEPYYSEPPHRPSSQPPKKKKKKKKRGSILSRFFRRMITTLLILFLLLFGVYSCTSLSLISQMEHVDPGNRSHYASSSGKGYVRNILIIGTDGRSADDRGRSDSMILLSLNSRTNEIIMTSLMRDCYVEIPGYGWSKLNASYAYGGADLLMDTIEHNFDIRLDDYVSIDFMSFASIVDSVGGLDIEVTDAEAEEINVILISEVNELMGDDRMSDLLDGGGKLHLNGKQTLSYSRIRKVGNSDFERTERQRRVMQMIIEKVKTFRPSIFVNLASDVMPDVSTNMSAAEMYLFSLRLPFALGYETKQLRIPVDGSFHGEDVPDGDYYQNVLRIDDWYANHSLIDNEIFADEKN